MKNFGYVITTKRLIENKRPVLFMYREKGDKGDSGWRFFSGSEDQAYVDDPNNIVICDIESILAIDGDIKPYLNSAYGKAFERYSKNEAFRISKDFKFAPEETN